MIEKANKRTLKVLALQKNTGKNSLQH